MISISRTLPSLCLTLALASCAPKASVVEEAPAAKMETPAVAQEPVSEEAPEMDLPAAPDNEIRVPGMLNLPTESEFRASSPQQPGSGSSGVFVRPPTDPPSRVKPTE